MWMGGIGQKTRMLSESALLFCWFIWIRFEINQEEVIVSCCLICLLASWSLVNQIQRFGKSADKPADRTKDKPTNRPTTTVCLSIWKMNKQSMADQTGMERQLEFISNRKAKVVRYQVFLSLLQVAAGIGLAVFGLFLFHDYPFILSKILIIMGVFVALAGLLSFLTGLR